MALADLFKDTDDTDPWEGKCKIPWDEPGFSRRMLGEHLSQDHDLASRRQDTIDLHIKYLHERIMMSRASRILDLGCGPGFYARRLAGLGHTVFGIDFSPASIEYAKNAQQEDQDSAGGATFGLGDMRTADLGEGYDLAMIIFGEFCAFSPEAAAAILARMKQSVVAGGQILIEAVTYGAIKQSGMAPSSWYRSPAGLFSDRRHICLIENHWDETAELAVSRFHVIDDVGEVAHYRNTLQAYSDDRFRTLFDSVGLTNIEILPAWGKERRKTSDEHLMLRARKS